MGVCGGCGGQVGVGARRVRAGRNAVPCLVDEEAQVLTPVMPLLDLGPHFPHLPDQ